MRVTTVLLAACVVSNPLSAQQDGLPGDVTRAFNVELKDGTGKSVGTIGLRPLAHGVLLSADLKSLPPGRHGFHIHEIGTCEAPDFKSAGNHVNPQHTTHGAGSLAGPHPGDLPNIEVSEQGTAKFEVIADKLTLEQPSSAATGAGSGEGSGVSATTPMTMLQGPVSLLDADGSAIVIHAEADDYKNQDSAGARIACGVLKKP